MDAMMTKQEASQEYDSYCSYSMMIQYLEGSMLPGKLLRSP